MQEELEALHKTHTRDIMDLPPGIVNGYTKLKQIKWVNYAIQGLTCSKGISSRMCD